MSLEFVPPAGLAPLAAGVAASVIVLALMWPRTRGAGRPLARALLVTLRGLVVLLVLLALAGPVLTSRPASEREQRPAVLVDTSRSMSVADAGNGGSRLEQALAVARAIAEECDVDLYAFDTTLRPLDLDDGAAADGRGSELNAMLGRLEGARAAVLLSDGIETGQPGGPPPGMPVHAVALGTDLGGVPNLGFRRVEFPERLDVGTKGEVSAEIVAAGPAGFLAQAGAVEVSVRENDRERTVATVDLSRGGGVTVTFEIEPAQAGFFRYQLLLPELGDEATHLDNRRELLVEAIRPDLRVLYFSKRLDQEFRAIRREAGQMPGVRFTSVIELSPGRFAIQGERTGDGLGRGLPEDAERLRRFHAIVLGSFPASELAASGHAALRAYVEGGGGLVWLAADDGFGRGGWNASPLAALTPLVFRAGDAAPYPRPLAVAVAPESQRNPLARGLRKAIEGAGGTLAVDGLYRFGAILPGAEVVLRAVGPGGESVPAVATRDVGKGRVIVLGASTWFRWRAPAPQAYATFWRQVLRHAASRDAERSRLFVEADRPRYEPGGVAVVTATVRDATLQPDPSAAVRGTLLDLDGKSLQQLPFSPSAGEPGRYTARVQLGGPGTLRVRVVATGKRGSVGEREALLRIGGEQEGERVARDRDVLRRLAESTGGTLRGPGDVEEIVRLLQQPPEADTASVSRSPLFDGPWGFLAIFLLALADWIARRRMKLI